MEPISQPERDNDLQKTVPHVAEDEEMELANHRLARELEPAKDRLSSLRTQEWNVINT